MAALRPCTISFFWMSLVLTPVAAESDLTVIGSSMPIGSPPFPAGGAGLGLPSCGAGVTGLRSAIGGAPGRLARVMVSRTWGGRDRSCGTPGLSGLPGVAGAAGAADGAAVGALGAGASAAILGAAGAA